MGKMLISAWLAVASGKLGGRSLAASDPEPLIEEGSNCFKRGWKYTSLDKVEFIVHRRFGDPGSCNSVCEAEVKCEYWTQLTGLCQLWKRKSTSDEEEPAEVIFKNATSGRRGSKDCAPTSTSTLPPTRPTTTRATTTSSTTTTTRATTTSSTTTTTRPTTTDKDGNEDSIVVAEEIVEKREDDGADSEEGEPSTPKSTTVIAATETSEDDKDDNGDSIVEEIVEKREDDGADSEEGEQKTDLLEVLKPVNSKEQLVSLLESSAVEPVLEKVASSIETFTTSLAEPEDVKTVVANVVKINRNDALITYLKNQDGSTIKKVIFGAFAVHGILFFGDVILTFVPLPKFLRWIGNLVFGSSSIFFMITNGVAVWAAYTSTSREKTQKYYYVAGIYGAVQAADLITYFLGFGPLKIIYKFLSYGYKVVYLADAILVTAIPLYFVWQDKRSTFASVGGEGLSWLESIYSR